MVSSSNDLEFNIESQIVISPNPTERYFHIKNNSKSKIKSINIINSMGQLIGEYQNTSNPILIKNSGIYFVNILTADGLVTKKIIVN